MEVKMVALYQGVQGLLYLLPEGKELVWGEWLLENNRLFRADSWGIVCGEEYSEKVQVVLPSGAQHIATYFPEHDQVIIHRKPEGHAMDYIYGAKE